MAPLRIVVVAVHAPLHWVIVDIPADVGPRFVVADDAFVVIALPNGDRWCLWGDRNRHTRLEGTNDITQCRGAIHRALWVHRALGIGQWYGCQHVVVGRHEWLPYGYQHPMQVVWHNNELIHDHAWEMFGNRAPRCIDDAPHVVQLHLSIEHLAEQTCAILRADRHEIRPCLCVVVALQAKRSAVAAIVVSHNCSDGNRGRGVWPYAPTGHIACQLPHALICRKNLGNACAWGWRRQKLGCRRQGRCVGAQHAARHS